MHKNWIRRFMEFLALVAHTDPEDEPGNPTWIEKIKFAFTWCIVQGRTEFAATKSPYLVCDDETLLVCDKEAT
jgi:hypothetical protein